MLKIENVKVSIGKNQILQELSLEVKKGEFLSLTGPSGCGKSTLLKIVCGLLPADSGHIFLEGECIDNTPIHKRGIGMLFQDLRLFPNMTVWENVAFSLKMQGVHKKGRWEAAHDWLKQVSLEGFENRRIHELSGGQQQRVALARAYAAAPKLLLLDEPFSSLDEELRLEMRKLLSSLHKTHGITIIFVTHDKAEAKELSNRVVVLNNGEIQG